MIKKVLLKYMIGIIFLVTIFPDVPNSLAAEPEITVVENQDTNQDILVEIFLSQERKKDINAIKNEFKRLSVTKVRTQFFKLGNPPENIAIGKNIPVSVAQSAIQLALTYNQGIKFIIAEKRVAKDYLAIGTSMLDETFQFPISHNDLKKLSDPSLTTSEFHKLYRHLTGDEN